jgi:hypothetical protein
MEESKVDGVETEKVPIHHRYRSEAAREAMTMALYVSIVLAAEFGGLSDQAHGKTVVLGVIWGTTVGLALAHVFAFNMTARLFAGGHVSPETRTAAWAQLAAAGVVAFIVSIPFVLFDFGRALDVAGFVVAALLGVESYLVSRESGARATRSIVDAVVVLLVAQALVSFKVFIAGH